MTYTSFFKVVNCPYDPIEYNKFVTFMKMLGNEFFHDMWKIVYP